MLILGRDRTKHPDRGYAKTFLTQLEESLGLASDRGVRIVANAGGLNPAGLAAAVRALAERLGVGVRVAHVEGDDLSAPAAELGLGEPLTANAYLGAWGIVDCLNAGADVVVTGRVTDASVIVGPAAAHFGWGAPTTTPRRGGGRGPRHRVRHPGHRRQLRVLHRNPGPDHPGFPLAELPADGSSVITKHPGTGGLGQRRHRHRPAALRDHRRPLRQPRRHRPDGHRRTVRGRPRPGPDQRGDRRAAAADPQGVAEQHRRVPQRDDVRAHRAGHRGEGRAGAAAARRRADRQARRAGVDAGPHRPPRRRHRGGGQRAAALRRPRSRTPPSSGANSPRPQWNWRWPAIPASP